MAKSDKRVELYINRSAEFAQPILWRIVELVHKACPEVEETLKWGMPYFVYKGSNLCGMAAFKQHCVFGFWLGSKMKDPKKILRTGENKTSMGNLGKMTSLKDLPSDKILIAYIKEAMSLIDKGEKLEKAAPVTNKTLKVPAYFLAALKKNKKAIKTFEEFSPSHKKEYVEWVTEAKTETTRESRLRTAIEWMSEGKARHWKYTKGK
jgi:uncharacterized protein YdeI (YjbR/CyaY-like superfamily)